jgi:hypothetical protein
MYVVATGCMNVKLRMSEMVRRPLARSETKVIRRMDAWRNIDWR